MTSQIPKENFQMSTSVKWCTGASSIRTKLQQSTTINLKIVHYFKQSKGLLDAALKEIMEKEFTAKLYN